ncbi:GPO family capsid scaffolding protein [Pasteurella skyensis]|uniref:GPO family capsid scaffolding protein n=1 Tax=Phocoenobacter skyensis TaxID=97481 RepID=A0AAJ6NAB0_9PAST|nr:GPO family capsid scaffolding protein [Pasteurella skyensis]MDP8173116.1 GPO family capsid scaffolding protein [Pasteurella skyensis]MDP8176339.1 GPO family capsid scaffolding protein [Pasteurella skyensis]MDP8178951.1 GPO family capsid scaffolding protein [Pasteurella skyensis]MDP8199148.1 GPO family capsid scaffolding protein [Pasteurella skyensis]
MAKRTKWFVVATEGATTDGRTINRSWIEQMSESYDPKKYGARINLEHIKTWLYRENEPHAKSYGDVTALKTAENEDGKLQLLAQIDPTDDLIKLNKDRQKIYTSVEIDPNFADSGKAYLVGLAVTDSPASLGTEMLVFASGAKNNPLSNRKQKPENLFSAAIATDFDFSDLEEKKEEFKVLESIKSLFSKKNKADNQIFADHQKAIELLGAKVDEQAGEIESLKTENTELSAKFAENQTAYEKLQNTFNQLRKEPEQEFSRPAVTGSETQEILTDC